MKGKVLAIILTGVFALVLFIVSVLGLFNTWMFIGMLLLGLLYLFGYLYVVNYYMFSIEEEKRENENKKKLDWCWNRTNQILKNMAGGQGLEWRSGIGRRSELRNYNDGIQNRPYRSIMGYLANTQQLVIVIFDIDNDDIVRYYANPTADIIENHFHEFKPYQQSSSLGSRYGGRYGFSRYGSRYGSSRYRPRGRPMNIHVDDGQPDPFDELPRNAVPTDEIASSAVEKLRKDVK